jgi:methyltransferase (TIGR00027 family)
MRSDTPSHTARLVARSLLLASKDERLCLLLAPQTAEVLEEIPEVSSSCFGAWVKRPWLRRLMFGIERLTLPGVITHYLVRKLGIENEVRNAIAAGAGRVVVVGAGFDTLAWRLHREFPDVQWIEVDHPATQEIKVSSLGQAPNLRYLPHNLASPRPLSRMFDQGDEGAVPTVIIIEGVTMYLTKEKVAELLKDCARLAGPLGRVILTFMEMDDHGSIDFRGQNRAVRWWLRLRAEPFLWGIPRRDLIPFLSDCGLSNASVIDQPDFRETFLAPRGLGGISLAEGECLCTCFPTLSIT